MAERLKVEVKFCGGNSFGGMYAKASRTILVPALRPAVRRAFTCSHELCHWHYGHGQHIDILDDIRWGYESSPQEKLANCYTGYLLMPPWAVDKASRNHGLTPAKIAPLDLYRLTCQFGVGYETVVQHLRWSLEIVDQNQADDLLKFTSKQLRESLVGASRTRRLVVADQRWEKVPVDLQVGEMAILPGKIQLEGDAARQVEQHELGSLVEAVMPGIAHVETTDGTRSVYIRVSRTDFAGRSIYRHLEDPDAD
jgi:Zn-dependent peptidase ImmA (M78 family)